MCLFHTNFTSLCHLCTHFWQHVHKIELLQTPFTHITRHFLWILYPVCCRIATRIQYFLFAVQYNAVTACLSVRWYCVGRTSRIKMALSDSPGILVFLEMSPRNFNKCIKWESGRASWWFFGLYSAKSAKWYSIGHYKSLTENHM